MKRLSFRLLVGGVSGGRVDMTGGVVLDHFTSESLMIFCISPLRVRGGYPGFVEHLQRHSEGAHEDRRLHCGGTSEPACLIRALQNGTWFEAQSFKEVLDEFPEERVRLREHQLQAAC